MHLSHHDRASWLPGGAWTCDDAGAMRIGVIVGLVFLGLGGSAEAAGALAGRILFQVGGQRVQPGELDVSPSAPIRVDFRDGRRVLSVRPDPAGLFSVPADPGNYRLEYVELAGRVEFFAPHDVDVRDTVLTCIGTLELTLSGSRPTGAGDPDGGLRVIDDCAQLGPALRQQARWSGALATGLPRAGAPLVRPRALVDLLTGVRVEVAGSLHRLGSVSGSVVYPFAGTLGSDSSWIASLSAGGLSGALFEAAAPATPLSPYGALGFGYAAQIVELGGFAGYVGRRGALPAGPLFGLSGRLSVRFLGVGVRVQRHIETGKTASVLTVDLSPVSLLGTLL